MPRTRKDTRCPIFGVLTPFKENVLPTYADVIKYYSWLRLEKLNENKQEPSVSDVCKKLVKDIKEIWKKSSISVVSDQQIFSQIKQYNDKYRTIKKSLKSKYKDNYNKTVQRFKESAETKLFDIASCKCKQFSTCKCKNKIPIAERQFLLDQRTNRKMAIGHLDIETTKKNQKAYERKSRELARKLKKSELQIVEHYSLSKREPNELGCIPSTSKAMDPSGPGPHSSSGTGKTSSSSQMRLHLPTLAEACDRTGISDRSAAIIVSAALKDVGIISDTDPSKIVDRSKIRRERIKSRAKLTKIFRDHPPKVQAICFDGRRDKTLVKEKKGNKYYQKTVTEEHYVLVSEPGSRYLGHVSPTSGSAKAIKTSILQFLQKNTDINTIVAIGCDGTVVNTGSKNGVIRGLESDLRKPLQWLVCLLHTNELPLRHLMSYLDGKTSGPSGFSGQIGKSLESCESLPVVEFKKIETVLPPIDVKTLSTDQKYMFEICQGICNGILGEDLALKSPGKMSHARWLTTANRVLRLYVATKEPSENLQILAEFIVKVYAVCWFEIKSSWSCKDGSRHLFNMIRRSRYLPGHLKKVIDPVIKRNGYYAHSENLLIAMIADDRKFIRELALRRILKCRKSSAKTEDVRIFRVNELNFDCEDYVDLIDWQNVSISEPPLTMGISDENLTSMICVIPDEIPLLQFPCHSQAVERCIKLVTEASIAVFGSEARDGFIKARIESRKILPQFETKKQFFKVLDQKK